MKRTFGYKEKYSLSYLYPAAAFVILAVMVYLSKYGIAMGSMTLLIYPNSLYVCVGLALIFVAYGAVKVRRAMVSASNPNPILVDDAMLSFPKGAKEKVEIALADIEGVVMREEDGDRVVVVDTEKNRYAFVENGFESNVEFDEFYKVLSGIVNRPE